MMRLGESTIGKFVLFIAVERDNTSMVNLLLSAGINVDARDHAGQTSLHRATRRGIIDMMKLLLRNGAEVNSKNDNSRTPWSANAASQNEAVLNVLLNAGADPNTQDSQGISELYLAACSGNTEYVKFLLRSGTHPDISTEFDWRPIHWAAYNGYIGTVKALISANADVSVVSDQDTTPLDLAIRSDQVEMVDLLVKAGAKKSEEFEGKILSKTHDLWKTRTHDSASNTQPGISQKLSLTFDRPFRDVGVTFHFGQYVYAIKQPKEGVFKPYQISHLLDTVTDTISVRRAESRAKMSEYPLPVEVFPKTNVLYDISRLTQDYQELKLQSNPVGPVHDIIRLHRDWTGSWKAHREVDGKTTLLFRTNPDWSVLQDAGTRWLTEEGTLLARTVTQENTLVFELGLDCWTQDALVTCWIGKVWAEQVSTNKYLRVLANSSEQ